KHAGGGDESGWWKKREIAGVADVIVDAVWAAFPCGADEFRSGVDAGGFHAAGLESAAENTLAAGDVDNRVAGGGGEQAENAGDYNVPVVFTAGFADELVIPVGDVPPVSSEGF